MSFLTPRLRRLLSTALLLAGPLGVGAWGAALASERGEHDHDQAHRALQAGEVMPLRSLLEHLERSHPGQVLDLELERDGGRWIYEIKLLQADGQRIKLKLDARTAEPLAQHTRRHQR